MKSVRVENGTATIYFHCDIVFCGHNGTGKFPPTGASYEQFTFEPDRDANGLIVFASGRSSYCHLYLYRYNWDGTKLEISQKVSTKRKFSLSCDHGLVVTFSKWSYVSQAQKETESNIKAVDISLLLKYIDGKAEIADLERNSRSLERQKSRIIRQKDEIDKLNGQILQTKKLLDRWFVKFIDRLFFNGALARM